MISTIEYFSLLFLVSSSFPSSPVCFSPSYTYTYLAAKTYFWMFSITLGLPSLFFDRIWHCLLMVETISFLHWLLSHVGNKWNVWPLSKFIIAHFISWVRLNFSFFPSVFLLCLPVFHFSNLGFFSHSASADPYSGWAFGRLWHQLSRYTYHADLFWSRSICFSLLLCFVFGI